MFQVDVTVSAAAAVTAVIEWVALAVDVEAVALVVAVARLASILRQASVSSYDRTDRASSVAVDTVDAVVRVTVVVDGACAVASVNAVVVDAVIVNAIVVNSGVASGSRSDRST